MDHPGEMTGRSWHWLRARVVQLFTLPPAQVIPRHGKPPLTVPATRIGWILRPKE